LDTGACIEPDRIIYVAPDGTDAGSCAVGTPCATLHYGVQQVTADRRDLVVAPGEYAGSGHTYLGFTDQIVSLHASGAVLATSMTPAGFPGGVFRSTGGVLTVVGLTIRQSKTGPPYPGVPVFSCTNGSLQLRNVRTDFVGESVVSDGCTVTIDQASLSNNRDVVDPRLHRSVRGTGGTMRVTRSTILDGIIELESLDFTLSNNLITSGIVVALSTGTATFNTITGTNLGEGVAGALLCGGAPPGPTFESNIFWVSPNAGTTQSIAAGTCTVTNNLLGPVDDSMNGNFSDDPRFENPGTGNYHLRAASPAIDQASTGPTIDVDGDARPHGASFDLGFDEATVP
jgi:hypothetical protein